MKGDPTDRPEDDGRERRSKSKGKKRQRQKEIPLASWGVTPHSPHTVQYSTEHTNKDGGRERERERMRKTIRFTSREMRARVSL